MTADQMPDEWVEYTIRLKKDPSYPYHGTDIEFNGCRYVRVDLAPAAQWDVAEKLAERFHEAYERLAPSFSYETRKASAKPWADVPENNKRLMIAVCAEIIAATPPKSQGVEVNYDADMWERELIKFVGTLSYTVWNICHNPTHADGNSDWFNDTLPHVVKGQEIIKGHIDKIRTSTRQHPTPSQAQGESVTVEELARSIKENPGEQMEHGLAASLLEQYTIIKRTE